MKEDINDINDLLAKYLAGEASEQERLQVEQWVEESADNKSYFNHLKIIFDRAAEVEETIDFDADEAWMNMKSKLAESKTKTVVFPQLNFVLRLAAMLIVAVGLGYFTYQWFNPETITTSIAATEVVVKDSLPDGTQTVLNRESTIQYIASRKERKVILKGEAFFDIKHDKEKQFIVETNGLMIEDIGTAFNVKSDEENKKVEVFVENGEVSLYTITSERFTLKAGEAGVFDLITQQFAPIVKLDTNRLAYKTGIFNFRNVKVETILKDLNSVYPLKVKVRNPAINNCKLTVTFRNERLEDVVAIIAESLSLTVTKEGDDFVLDGVGCDN